ncbi:MAG: ABC transporter ATP-binding protein [Xanthobacteraceae bacterium]
MSPSAQMPERQPTAPLLSVDDLRISFRSGTDWVQVVDGASFDIARGETIGIVGESGSGKTVTGLSILGLLVPGQARTQGSIRFLGKEINGLPESEMRKIRGRHISMIFQEPMTALDPVFTIGDQIAETLRAHHTISKKEARERAIEALRQVGISLPERRIDEFPHQLSGGMRQRVMIAIALACEPDLLIADEPTTALDVTIQAQIIELLQELVQARKTSLIFISHNLGVVSQCCTRMVTMYAGQVVENGPIDDVLERPYHPYTSGLLRSMPTLAQPGARLPSIGGRVPAPQEMPPGCHFQPRCRHAIDDCLSPQPLRQADDRQARCLRYSELNLPGVTA